MGHISQAPVLSFPFSSHSSCYQAEYGDAMPKEMQRNLLRLKQCLQDLISKSVD